MYRFLILTILACFLSLPVFCAVSPQTIQEIETLLSEKKQFSNFINLWRYQSRILCIAERHDTLSDKDELIKNLQMLHGFGFTHLALEFIPQSMKDDLKDYLEKRTDSSKLMNYLQTSWTNPTKHHPDTPAKVMEIIDKAHKIGFRIHAIDVEGTVSERNEKWANKVEKILSSGGNVIVYGGDSHFAYTDTAGTTFNDYMKSKHKKTTLIKFSGGVRPPLTNISYYTDVISVLAKAHNFDQENFSLKLDQSNKDRAADYIVHLKQN